MQDKIIIFSDGASKGNPGPGGWGVVVIKLKVNKVEGEKKEGKACPNLHQGRVIELGGREEYTTNNRMELSGAIAGLTQVKKNNEEVIFYTDSKYVIGGMTEWVKNWQKNKWRTAQKKAVLNKDLWEKLSSLAEGKKIQWQYVAGHSGHPGNERCDEIASGLALGDKVDLYDGPLSDYKIKISELGVHE